MNNSSLTPTYKPQRRIESAYIHRDNPIAPNYTQAYGQTYFDIRFTPTESTQSRKKTPNLDHIETIMSPSDQATTTEDVAIELHTHLAQNEDLAKWLGIEIGEPQENKGRIHHIIWRLCSLVHASTNTDSVYKTSQCIVWFLNTKAIAAAIGEIESGSPKVLNMLFQLLKPYNNQTRTANNATMELIAVNITLAILDLQFRQASVTQ